MSNLSADNADDPNSWNAIFHRMRPGLRRFLAAKLPQDADVEDCLQAVSVAMLQNEASVPVAARKAWLFRVAANQAALWWRRRGTTDRVMEKHSHYALTEQNDDATSHLEQDETIRQIQRSIERLPVDSQEIIQKRIHEGLTFQEIADQLQIPLGTVLTKMRRAMERLRREISDD